MRHSLKKVVIPALAVVTALSMSVPGYAASSSDEKISSVKLKVVLDSEPEAGDTVGTPEVTISESAHYTISEAPEFYDTNDDEWERGEIPVIRLELEAEDGYRFTSSTKVSVSGFHSDVKSKKVMDSGDGLRIDIKLRAVSGDLEEVDDYYWDGTTAYWDDVEDANKYEVKLYRNSTSVTTITTSSNHHNFYPYMTKAGDYTFKVRAISTSDGEKSEWTDESDECYISSSEVYTGAAPTTTDYTTTTTTSTGPVSGNYNSGWVQDQYGWKFWNNGVAVSNSWVYVDNNWFYLGSNAYMMTGWVYVDNNWFYLNPVSDGTQGAMLTGIQVIDGAYYYLNPVSDGTKGARLTGYQNINGNWYYFNPQTGAMMNNTTVDGRWIDGSGVVQMN